MDTKLCFFVAKRKESKRREKIEGSPLNKLKDLPPTFLDYADTNLTPFAN